MNRVFNVLVAGSNPQEIMEKYDYNKEVLPYVLHKLDDMDKIYANRIYLYESILSSKDKLDIELLKQAQLCLKRIKQLTPFAYYQQMSQHYILDKDTGDLLTTENPEGKYETLQQEFLLLVGDDEVSQAQKKDINFDKLHRNENRLNLQKRAYDLCVNLLEPEDETDKLILQNMGDLNSQSYFDRFDDKEQYALYCESLGFYAFVNENEWIEIPSIDNEILWKIDFYDKFIKDLTEDTLLTTYVCTK